MIEAVLGIRNRSHVLPSLGKSLALKILHAFLTVLEHQDLHLFNDFDQHPEHFEFQDFSLLRLDVGKLMRFEHQCPETFG